MGTSNAAESDFHRVDEHEINAGVVAWMMIQRKCTSKAGIPEHLV